MSKQQNLAHSNLLAFFLLCFTQNELRHLFIEVYVCRGLHKQSVQC